MTRLRSLLNAELNPILTALVCAGIVAVILAWSWVLA